MKKRILEQMLKKNGWIITHGGEHDIASKAGFNKISIPRHTEIKEVLAKKILRQAEIEK